MLTWMKIPVDMDDFCSLFKRCRYQCVYCIRIYHDPLVESSQSVSCGVSFAIDLIHASNLS